MFPTQSTPSSFQRQLSDIDTTGQQQQTALASVESRLVLNVCYFNTHVLSKYDLALSESDNWVVLWNSLVSLMCIYNLIAVPFLSFDEITLYYYRVWLGANLVADCVYLLDLPFQCFICMTLSVLRVMMVILAYYSMGLLVRDFRRIGRAYVKKWVEVTPKTLLLICLGRGLCWTSYQSCLLTFC